MPAIFTGPRTRLPKITISPESGGISPVTSFIKDDLPHPEGPTTAANSPRPTLRLVPWSASAQFRMPISAWRAMIAEHYPGGGWIRLSEETLGRLNARRSGRGLPSFEACIEELLDDR